MLEQLVAWLVLGIQFFFFVTLKRRIPAARMAIIPPLPFRSERNDPNNMIISSPLGRGDLGCDSGVEEVQQA